MSRPVAFSALGDAWCGGQIESKLWLCRHLEAVGFGEEQTIWILGGWYALTAQLLFVRERLPIDRIRSFDIDPDTEVVADVVNEPWVSKRWRFKAFTRDCNDLDYARPEQYSSPPPTVVINTACEHFEHDGWWERIPAGMMVALQSNDQRHDDHVGCFDSLEQFDGNYEMTETVYRGSLLFDYGKWSFSRWMKIGRK